MSVVFDSIIGGIAWKVFSEQVSFWNEKIKDFVLKTYINNELKVLDISEKKSSKQLEEISDVIEFIVDNVPEDIKIIQDKENQKEAFEKYCKRVIINSFDNNSDTTIDVKFGKDYKIQESFNNNKNSTIRIR